MRRSFLALVGVVLLAGSAAVGAHHSYANFSDKITSIEGTLEKVMFANPHVVLTIRTKVYRAAIATALRVVSIAASPRPLQRIATAAAAASTTNGTSASEKLPVASLMNPIAYIVTNPARLLRALICASPAAAVLPDSHSVDTAQTGPLPA